MIRKRPLAPSTQPLPPRLAGSGREHGDARLIVTLHVVSMRHCPVIRIGAVPGAGCQPRRPAGSVSQCQRSEQITLLREGAMCPRYEGKPITEHDNLSALCPCAQPRGYQAHKIGDRSLGDLMPC